MKKLNKNELKLVRGGTGLSAWGIFGILISIIFGIGVIDGYVTPSECN